MSVRVLRLSQKMTMVFWNVTPHILVANSIFLAEQKTALKMEATYSSETMGPLNITTRNGSVQKKNESMEVYVANLKKYSCIRGKN